jgi:hypothetical protein
MAGALRLIQRAARAMSPIVVGLLLVVAGVAVAVTRAPAAGLVMCGGGAMLAGIGGLVARRRLGQLGDVEIAFWDVAGEHVYSSTAADYYALMSNLVEARRRRAEERGRAYVFAPVLICNPITLGTADEGSPYERLRELLPLFAALDRDDAHALVAINRWGVVDALCERGKNRDEVVSVTAKARGETASPAKDVARDLVRSHCLDAEDGRDGDVRFSYLRYDTAIKSSVDVDTDEATLTYDYDDGPGAFSGKARHRFLDWLVGLVSWRPVPATVRSTATADVHDSVPTQALGSVPPPLRSTAPVVQPSSHEPEPEVVAVTEAVWSRPFDASSSRPR